MVLPNAYDLYNNVITITSAFIKFSESPFRAIMYVSNMCVRICM